MIIHSSCYASVHYYQPNAYSKSTVNFYSSAGVTQIMPKFHSDQVRYWMLCKVSYHTLRNFWQHWVTNTKLYNLQNCSLQTDFSQQYHLKDVLAC